jgi:hypothetical protein
MTWLLGIALALGPVADLHRELASHGPEQVAHLVGLAEAALETAPDDPWACFVLAQSLFEGGALAAALRRFRDCEAALARRSDPGLPGSGIHGPSLVQARIAACLGAMGRSRDEQAVWRDYLDRGGEKHEEANGIRRPGIHHLISSLAKDGNFREAETWIGEAERRRIPGTEMERLRLELLTDASGNLARARLDSLLRASGGYASPDCPLEQVLYHAFLSAYQDHPDDAEAAYRVCVERRAEAPDLFPPPRLDLAQLQLARDDFPAALASLQAAWEDLAAMTPLARRDSAKHLRLRAAQFLLAAGYPEEAWETCRPLLRTPVRFGSGTLRRAASWRAGLHVTALASLEQSRLSPADWLATRAEARRLRLSLHRELDGILRESAPDLDLLSAVDVPPRMWPLLRAATSPALLRALETRHPLRGPRAERLSRIPADGGTLRSLRAPRALELDAAALARLRGLEPASPRP